MTILAACLALLVLAGAGDAPPAEPFPTGRLVQGIACRTDPSQTYTLYLPAGYPGKRRWPALLVLDPRGRSVLAAELFQEAAETYGWILVSSDNTRSDGPMEPNNRVLNALWPEVNTRYATDHGRVYAAGFSGGAHFSWLLGKKTGGVAGVIASGGRLIPEYLEGTSFALYGAAGDTDFNYQGMRRVDALMAEQGNPHRLEIFAGPHRWMPPELAMHAVAWMELEAMRGGLRERDQALIERLYSGDLAVAQELEAGGEVLAARRRYEAIARTFAGLCDIRQAEKKAGVLAASAEHARALAEEQRWLSYEEHYLQRMFNACATLADADVPVSVGSMVRDLRLGTIERQAEAAGVEGATARRLLATVSTQTSFYLAGQLRSRREHGKEAVALAVAAGIRPEDPVIRYNLACAHALNGRKKRALEALEQAVDLGWSDRDHTLADPDLESLRDDRRFKLIVASME